MIYMYVVYRSYLNCDAQKNVIRNCDHLMLYSSGCHIMLAAHSALSSFIVSPVYTILSIDMVELNYN
jgi:hypothetical protein